MSPTAAKFTPTMLWFMIIIGRLLCAGLARRLDRYVLLLVIGIGFSACFSMMILGKTSVICITGILGAGLFMAGIYPTTISECELLLY